MVSRPNFVCEAQNCKLNCRKIQELTTHNENINNIFTLNLREGRWKQCRKNGANSNYITHVDKYQLFLNPMLIDIILKS